VDRGCGPPFRRLASEAVAVKFLRHFTAAVLVVAVIVGLGMLWAHPSGVVTVSAAWRRRRRVRRTDVRGSG
jgi:hypothetical protein